MLYQKQGLPEEDELVLCTVTNVQHHSVFARLDEYGKTGMIHISEVSPGRIRNIRDYVQEGKKVICKVLRTDPVKGHIDLSLRRVNEGQRRRKTEEIKHEQKAEKIIESFAKKLKQEVKNLYETISSKVFERYEYIYECFEDIVNGAVKLEDLGFDKELAKKLTKIIKEKIKPIEVVIKGDLNIVSYAPDGVDVVKNALKKAGDVSKNIVIKYKGAGKYNVVITASDYKKAEKILKKISDAAIGFIDKKEGIGSFERAG